MTNYGTNTASVGIFGVYYQYRYSGCVPVCDWRSFQPINKFATHGKQEYEDTMVTATPEQVETHATDHSPAGSRSVLMGLLLVAGIVLLAVGGWSISSDSTSSDTTLVFYTVKR